MVHPCKGGQAGEAGPSDQRKTPLGKGEGGLRRGACTSKLLGSGAGSGGRQWGPGGQCGASRGILPSRAHSSCKALLSPPPPPPEHPQSYPPPCPGRRRPWPWPCLGEACRRAAARRRPGRPSALPCQCRRSNYKKESRPCIPGGMYEESHPSHARRDSPQLRRIRPAAPQPRAPYTL